MIKVDNISKSFGGTLALDRVSCTVSEGSIYGMIGSNGAGKSTFLRVLSGVYRPDSGSVTVDGEALWNNPSAKGKIMFVPDELFFLPGANMKRMESLYASLFPRFDKKRFSELTEAFRLDPKAQINSFSKGMKRQAATALALAARPDYLFFDETFDGLDPIMRHFVKRLIGEDVLDRGTTAVITSHSLRELEDTCDQLAMLHRGGLVLESDIQDLKTDKFKIQVAYREEIGREAFADIDVKHFSRQGSVINMIVSGDREKTVEKLKRLDPVLLEVLPMTLEEVFVYELESLGYAYGEDDIEGVLK